MCCVGLWGTLLIVMQSAGARYLWSLVVVALFQAGREARGLRPGEGRHGCGDSHGALRVQERQDQQEDHHC